MRLFLPELILAFLRKLMTSLGVPSNLDLWDLASLQPFNFTVHNFYRVNESEEYNNQVNDRYKESKWYHVVPPPFTGNFMPPRPDLSFVGLDNSGFKSSMSEAVTSVHETKASASMTSKESMEKPKIVRSIATIIKE
nr:hypothetical protein [Tanacetum cinerariifolium]